MPPPLSSPNTPNLNECARHTVPTLVPLIAARLTVVVDAGDRRAKLHLADEDERLGYEGEVKKVVRFKDRVDRARSASKGGDTVRDCGEGPSSLRGESALDEDEDAPQRGSSRFFARDRPGMTVEAYLSRITMYTPIPLDALLLTLAYLNRISRYASTVASDALFPSVSAPPCPPRDPQDRPVPIDSRTIHRLLLSTLLISAKFASDAYIPHARAAKVCGVSEEELHSLEVEIFKLLGWSLYWELDELESIARTLLHGDDVVESTDGSSEDIEMTDGNTASTTPVAPPPPMAGAFRTDLSLNRHVSSNSVPRRSSLHSSGRRPTTPPPARVVNFATPSPTPTPPSSSAPSTPSPPGTPGSPYSAKSGRSSRSNNSRGSRSKSTTPRLIVAEAVEGLAEELREGMMLDAPDDEGAEEWYSDVEDVSLEGMDDSLSSSDLEADERRSRSRTLEA